MNFNPYLMFNGNCKEAFEFYERVLGGKIEFIQTFGDSPMGEETSSENRDKIIHVCMRIGDQLLMGSDSPSEYFEKPQGFGVALHADSATEGERLFNALAEGGQVKMPFEKTFWAERFGMVDDRFGTPWMVNYTGKNGQ